MMIMQMMILMENTYDDHATNDFDKEDIYMMIIAMMILIKRIHTMNMQMLILIKGYIWW